MSLYLIGNAESSHRPRISGRSLVQRKASPRQRSCMAAQVVRGEADYTPTMRQIAAEFRVSISYLNLALSLSPEKRASIAKGKDQTSFALLKTFRKQQLLTSAAG